MWLFCDLMFVDFGQLQQYEISFKSYEFDLGLSVYIHGCTNISTLQIQVEFKVANNNKK